MNSEFSTLSILLKTEIKSCIPGALPGNTGRCVRKHLKIYKIERKKWEKKWEIE